MILIENTKVSGYAPAIRGMRNPLNSWDKSDSDINEWDEGTIGDKDFARAYSLSCAGTSHSKYRRMIVVWIDITAPLYWWKEFDTYKVGTVANSCSTMHKIDARDVTEDDFSIDHMTPISIGHLNETIKLINKYRWVYKHWDAIKDTDIPEHYYVKDKKDAWWQMIQLLPESYNQKRTVMLNYEVLANIYSTRENHKLDEWLHFREWIENLPYSQLITLKKEDTKDGL